MVGRPFFLSRILSFHLQNATLLSTQNCIKSIPVASAWISPLLSNVIEFVSNHKPLTTRASPDEEEVAAEILDETLAAVENDLLSTREICAASVDKLCKAGNISAAVRLLQFLRDKNISIGPNAYNIILGAAGERNDIEMLSQLFKDLLLSCKSVPSTSYVNVAKGFVKTNDHVLLLRLVREVAELTIPGNMIVINRLIFAFAECRQFDKALLIFDQIKGLKCKPDLITYNTVLDILGRAGQVDEMLHEFASMKEVGIVPDFISYNTLLNHLRKVGRLDLSLVYFREMAERGIEPDLLTYTALIDSFGKSGNTEESLRLFSEMKMRKIRPSIYVYRSLINALKKMGKEELAMTLLEEMNASLSNLAGPKEFKRKGR